MKLMPNTLSVYSFDGIKPEGWRVVHPQRARKLRRRGETVRPLMDGNYWTGAYLWKAEEGWSK